MNGIKMMKLDKENTFPQQINIQQQSNETKKGKIWNHIFILECSKRREKSLLLLSQKFVQLFLISQSPILSHEQAVKILIHNNSSLSTTNSKKNKCNKIYKNYSKS